MELGLKPREVPLSADGQFGANGMGVGFQLIERSCRLQGRHIGGGKIKGGQIGMLFRCLIIDFPNDDLNAAHRLLLGVWGVMLDNNVPLVIVSKILGHSSPAITATIYTHALDDSKSGAIAGLSQQLTQGG